MTQGKTELRWLPDIMVFCVSIILFYLQDECDEQTNQEVKNNKTPDIFSEEQRSK